MICNCTTSISEQQIGIVACGDFCLNRSLMIECGERCACGNYCTNRNFKTKNNANIQYISTSLKGYGLKSAKDSKKLMKRFKNYSDNDHFYIMSFANNLYIDATKKGNLSRFFNHSCDPNCEKGY